MRNALFVCETPWDDDDGVLVEWSMRPFAEGVARRKGWRFLYRTFTTGRELASLLRSEVPQRPGTRVIVYVSSHGSGGRINTAGSDVNVATVARGASRQIEGIWLGACDIGRSRALTGFLEGGGAVWAGGYTGEVSWDATALIDQAVLGETMRSGPVRDQAGAVRALAKSLRGFSGDWNVGHGGPLRLRDAIRLVARSRVQGSRPRDMTTELLDKLGWTDTE